MDSSNAEKAAREAYIAYHEGLSGFDAARAWDDMTSPADDWSQEAVDWEYAIKAALASRDAEVEVLREQLAAAALRETLAKATLKRIYNMAAEDDAGSWDSHQPLVALITEPYRTGDTNA